MRVCHWVNRAQKEIPHLPPQTSLCYQCATDLQHRKTLLYPISGVAIAGSLAKCLPISGTSLVERAAKLQARIRSIQLRKTMYVFQASVVVNLSLDLSSLLPAVSANMDIYYTQAKEKKPKSRGMVLCLFRCARFLTAYRETEGHQ